MEDDLRRSQIITINGIGSLFVTKFGIGIIGAGLDYWFSKKEGENIDLDEYIIKDEWRLARTCNVRHFKIPPDFRPPTIFSRETVNINIKLPYLRFPTWHFCQNRKCANMRQFSPTTSDMYLRCHKCNGIMVQVPLISMCPDGHLDEFPYREWIERSCHKEDPERKKSHNMIKFIHTGGEGVSGYMIKCECGAFRSLNGSLGELDIDCRGKEFWNHDHKENKECTNKNKLHGTLRGATNLYYSNVRSSIFIPRGGPKLNDDIVQDFRIPLIRKSIEIMYQTLKTEGKKLKAVHLKQNDNVRETFVDYKNEDIDNVIESEFAEESQDSNDDNYDSSSFKFAEYNFIKEKNDKIVDYEASEEILDGKKLINEPINKYFDQIKLIKKLRETRALIGFSRVIPRNVDLEDSKRLLWKDKSKINEWLPAVKVYGEGIFLKFNETKIKDWEKNQSVLSRINKMRNNHKNALEKDMRDVNEEKIDSFINPRYVLIHTFSHLLINKLSYYAGYSETALKERIYASLDNNNNMSGLLIYTADGDSDGTMGGLVKLGRVNHISSIIEEALNDAKWCTIDPICMEAGSDNTPGQGTHSVNLAACHNCCHIPETACENFNSFLDRGIICGSFDNPEIGYFDCIK